MSDNPHQPASVPGEAYQQRRTGLIVVIAVSAVVVLGVAVTAVLLLASRSDYPEDGLTAEEIQALFPEGDDVPAGGELEGGVDTDSGQSWEELRESLEANQEAAAELYDQWETHVDDIDGVEECIAADEDHREFLISRADSEIDDGAEGIVSTAVADYRFDGAMVAGYAASYGDDPGRDDNPWLEMIEFCTPVQAGMNDEQVEVEIIEDGDIEGFTAVYDDRAEVSLTAEYGQHSVEYWSDSVSPQEVEATVSDLTQMLEYAEARLLDLD